MLFFRLLKFWIILSTLATVAGWTLSAFGLLNEAGYIAFAVLVFLVALAFRKSFVRECSFPSRDFRKLRHRLRRFLPAAFSVLAVLVFVSGVLYAPNDHTGLSYRLPRVLQWLSHGHWFWIRTPNYRMNDRACGIEWLSAPLLLFTHSDRALFLVNFIPFLLLPGLIFSVWTRLGVRPRTAWAWMWLFPTGYCFLMQAGGIANDALPAVYALAMMDFALRAREKISVIHHLSPSLSPTSWRRGGKLAPNSGVVPQRANFPEEFYPASDLCLSLLSAALMVGVKANNLPLGLPWACVFFPLLPRLWAQGAARGPQNVSKVMLRALSWVVVVVVAALISFLPSAILNVHYLHDWSGSSIEQSGMGMKNPLAGILGNGFLLVTNNFAPTFFPLAGWWNQHAMSLLPGWFHRLMDANFEGGYNNLGEMPTEDWSGLGFGVTVLLLVSVVAGWSVKSKTGRAALVSRFVLIAPWISLIAYSMKAGIATPGRLFAAFYPLLFPVLLIAAAQSQIVRRAWWQFLAGLVMLLALAALIVTPARPLWPAKTILAKLAAAHPNQRQLVRSQKVYEVYSRRSDPLAGMREWIPSGVKVVGFMGTDDDLDISFWKPYWSRRVEPFFAEDPPDDIRKLGIEYAFVSGLQLDVKHITFDVWLQKSGAQLLATTNATLTVSQGPAPWYFVRFK